MMATLTPNFYQAYHKFGVVGGAAGEGRAARFAAKKAGREGLRASHACQAECATGRARLWHKAPSQHSRLAPACRTGSPTSMCAGTSTASWSTVGCCSRGVHAIFGAEQALRGIAVSAAVCAC